MAVPDRVRAALLRRDWSMKPNAWAFLNLIYGEWWTDVTGATGEDGTLSVRAFKGDYRIAAGAGDKISAVSARITGPEMQLTVTLN